MSSRGSGPITNLLAAYRAGRSEVLHELLHIVLPELRRIAGLLMRRERAGHLLRPTGLVNEAFLRLFDGKPIPFENSHDFFAASVRHMRRVLTDYARAKLAQKRQEPTHPVELSGSSLTLEELLDIGRALEGLHEHHGRAAKIVELKFYAGFSIQEIAAVLDVSPRTVVREWVWARTFLRVRLNGVNCEDFPPLIE